MLSDELQEKFAKRIDGRLVFDFSSTVDIRHPNAIEFLERDIKNITRFFVKRRLTVENSLDILKRMIK
jgi:RIO kinase 1